MKFIFKEEYTPAHVDKVLYILAPMSILAAALAIFAVMPFGSVLPLAVPGTDAKADRAGRGARASTWA